MKLAAPVNFNQDQKQDNKQSETLDLLSSAQSIIQEAVPLLGYNNDMYELLKVPLKILTLRIPIRWMIIL